VNPPPLPPHLSFTLVEIGAIHLGLTSQWMASSFSVQGHLCGQPLQLRNQESWCGSCLGLICGRRWDLSPPPNTLRYQHTVYTPLSGVPRFPIPRSANSDSPLKHHNLYGKQQLRRRCRAPLNGNSPLNGTPLKGVYTVHMHTTILSLEVPNE